MERRPRNVAGTLFIFLLSVLGTGIVTSDTALLAMVGLLILGPIVMTWFFDEGVETGVLMGLGFAVTSNVLFALHDLCGLTRANAITIFVITAALLVIAMEWAIVAFDLDVRRDFAALDKDE